MTTDEIRAARARLGLSTWAFGAMFGVTERAVENWEQGRRPGKAMLRLIDLVLAHPAETTDPNQAGGCEGLR